MASVHDVAGYILRKQGSLTAMKLQKLVYYSQAWSLVWEERPLFEERIEAWANGPVVPALYMAHGGRFIVDASAATRDGSVLDVKAIETIDAVLDYYGPHTAQWLSDLTHAEAPWRDARRGLAPGERGHEEITLASMAEYYGGLSDVEEAPSVRAG